VEYLVFEEAWRKAGHEGPPRFGAEPFVLMKDDPATRQDESHMLDAHYELHLWVHRENPLGVFKEFNPRVSCANYAARGLSHPDIQAATWPEAGHGAPQVSTEELRTILRRGDALVLDVRKPREYHLGHIPGTFGLESGDGPAAVVATARRLLRMDRTRALVLYGDGVNSTETTRGAEALMAEGFVNVRRYQLGLAVWQALGGVTELDPEGLVLAWRDRSAVFVDGRESAEVQGDRLTGMILLEVPQVARGAGEGKLPADPTTRVVAVGRDATQARALAEQLVRRGYRRVSLFGGSWAEFRRITGPAGREPAP
jgi:rhodanese-related sulfurtransferase